MKSPVLLSVLLGAIISNANAFTLNLEFPEGLPKAIDFEVAVSTGVCSPTPTSCFTTSESYVGVKRNNIHKFMRDMNSTFDSITPVPNPLVYRTNYAEIKTQGQSNVCLVNLLGKPNIRVKILADGSCTE